MTEQQGDDMTNERTMKALLTGVTGLAAAMLAACSGPTEDVRVSFCKNIATALQPEGAEVTWGETNLAFQRPSHAVTQLSFDVTTADGTTRPVTAGCWYRWERREQLASAVANPIEEYETLPYAMTYEGERLSDEEVGQLVRAEQKRQGLAVIDRIEEGAKDVAEQVRAGITN
jgi:hypothetical protein